MINKRLEFFDQLISVSWIFEKIYWKILDYLIYDQQFENFKQILKIAWYIDVDSCFKKKFDKNNFFRVNKTIFQFYENIEKKHGEKDTTNNQQNN
jgi:hypothetical protein